MVYTVRRVRGEDWERVRELRLAALADPIAPVAFHETYAFAVAQDDEFWRGRAGQSGEGGLAVTFVGEDEEDGGRWAGTATALLQGKQALVVAVYLRPEHRGRGLATQLFDALHEWAAQWPQVTRTVLHVHEHNPRAEALYRRLGYVRTGEHVADPQNPVLRDHEMARDLRGAARPPRA